MAVNTSSIIAKNNRKNHVKITAKLRESTSIRIQPDIWHRAKIEAAIQKVNLSDLIEQALEVFIKTNGSQITIKPNGKTGHKIPAFEF